MLDQMLAYNNDAARAVLCVPARNEVELLPGLLRSLAAQEGLATGCVLKIVVVVNNSTDGTAEAVRDITLAHKARLDIRLIEIELPAETAHVGTARRIAMDAAADWLAACGFDDGIILTTDADAVAPANWVAANLEALETAEVVGGRLLMAPDPMRPPAMVAMHRRIEAYWAAVRALEDALDPPPEDPSPRHGDHTAASLAVRASVYRRVGGLPVLRSGEDNALVAAIRALGGRVRHAPDVSIIVSARETGRADGGMASEMTRRGAIFAAGSTYEVPVASHWLARLRSRAQLRAAWTDGGARWTTLAKPICDLDRNAFPNVIAFLHHCETMHEASPATQPLDDAIAALDGFRRDALMRHVAE